jgi:CubicO group peptidase (beta-lactamase class C family)
MPWVCGGLCTLAFLAIGASALAVGHPNEDAYILFRYVENVAAGAGIVYNPGGPRAEGATDFLWLALLSALRWLGVDVALAALLLNALGAGSAAILCARAIPACGSARGMLLACIPLLLVCNAALASYVGFSAMLYSALFLAALALAVEASDRRLLALPVLGLVIALFRPDGVVVGIAFAALGLVRARRAKLVRGYVATLVASSVAGGTYAIWRYLYFGLPLPLPLYVKSVGAPSAWLAKLPALAAALPGFDENVRWLLGAFTPLPLVVAALGLAAWARTERTTRLLAASIPASLLLVELCFAQQSQNVAFRFQAPLFVVLFYALLQLATWTLEDLASPRARAAVVALVLAALAVPALGGARALESLLQNRDRSYLQTYAARLAPLVAAHEVLATTEAGQLGYWSRGRVADVVGLNEPRFARTPVSSLDLERLDPPVLMFHHGNLLDSDALARLAGSDSLVTLDASRLRERSMPAPLTGTRRAARAMIAYLAASDRYEVLAIDERGARRFKHIWAFRRDWPQRSCALALLREALEPQSYASYLALRTSTGRRRTSACSTGDALTSSHRRIEPETPRSVAVPLGLAGPHADRLGRLVETHGAQPSAPDAAGVEREDTFAVVVIERGPVPEHHTAAARASRGDAEPRHAALRDRVERPLEAEVETPFRIAYAQPGEAVDDEPPAVRAVQPRRPAVGTIAVHVREELAHRAIVAQHGLDLARTRPRGAQIPLRCQACVHHRPADARVVVQEGPVAQPVEQLVAVACAEDVVERVGRPRAMPPVGREREQMQVVIAEHDLGGGTERAHVAEHLQRLRTAIDQIAHQPNFVVRRVEGELAQQRLQLDEAALHVSDRIGGHPSWVGIADPRRLASTSTCAGLNGLDWTRVADESRIEGTCDARFAAVRDAFRENFVERGEVGAAVAVTLDGRWVVDLWGGYADAAGTRPWQHDTLVNVFSVGKAMTALCVHLLVERGALDLDTPVVRDWPDFAPHGKERVTLREILAHRAGLPAIRRELAPLSMYDWELMTRLLAEEEPWWEPGSRHGYHVNTFGYLLGELVRRASGATLGAFFRREVAERLGADFHFGIGPEHDGRIADSLLPSRPIPVHEEDPERARMVARAYSNPEGISGNGTVNTRAWRAAEIPSTNGHANARAVARIYTPLACDGRVEGMQLLSPETIREATREASFGPDAVLPRVTRMGLGYQLTFPGRPLGPNPRAFGHFGAGGSLGIADPDARLAFAYTLNRPGPRWNNPCTRAVLDAVYAGLV